MTQNQMAECMKYAKRIKNPAKREYAYIVIFNYGHHDDIPLPVGLSRMAAQAVRMNIDDIVRGQA